MNDKENDMKPKLEDMHVLKELEDMFPEEVPGLPPKRDIDFTIDLIPGAVLLEQGPAATGEAAILVDRQFWRRYKR